MPHPAAFCLERPRVRKTQGQHSFERSSELHQHFMFDVATNLPFPIFPMTPFKRKTKALHVCPCRRHHRFSLEWGACIQRGWVAFCGGNPPSEEDTSEPLKCCMRMDSSLSDEHKSECRRVCALKLRSTAAFEGAMASSARATTSKCGTYTHLFRILS